jgi:hypothetical protein
LYAQPLAERLQLGAALGFAVPGATAHALDFGAPVVTALGLLAWQVRAGPLLSAQLGFRLDQSAHAAPELMPLSRAERMSLGLSDFNAVPIGLAALHHYGPVDLAAELSGEILIGEQAPALLRSPLRAAVVARLPLSSGVTLEALLRLGLSQRPKYARVTPLIPVEPRLVVGFGIRFAPESTRPAPPPAAPLLSELAGDVRDNDGAPIAGARLSLAVGAEVRQAETAPDGTFSVPDLPRGAAQLEVTAEDHLPTRQNVVLDRTRVELTVRVEKRVSATQLRGLVRSFSGAPLPAHVHVVPAGASVTADNAGRFMLELPPGVYQVEIECGGYLPQRRKVSVQENGVTLLNVELHSVQR